MIKYTIAEKLKEKHYSDLNQKLQQRKDGRVYHAYSVIYKIKKAKNKTTNRREKLFYSFLLGRGYSRIKKILIGSPKDLYDIIKEFNEKYFDIKFSTLDNDGNKKNTDVGNELEKIFNYDTFRGKPLCIDYLKKLGFEESTPCPYCNLDNLRIPKNKALLDLDHFFPQSEYPFLALSLSNLIPSCHNCNSRYKLAKEFTLDTHINPFDKSFDEYFYFTLEDVFIPYNSDITSIKCNKIKPFPSLTISDLGILDRYLTEKKTIKKKLSKIITRHNKKKTEYESLFGSYSVEELLDDFDVPFSISEIKGYSLGKLMRDLCIDFKVIKKRKIS